MSTTTFAPLQQSNEEIVDNIFEFLNTLRALINSCVDYSIEKEKFSKDENFVFIYQSLTDSLFSSLLEKDKLIAPVSEWINSLKEQDRNIILLIAGEMQYYIERYPVLNQESARVVLRLPEDKTGKEEALEDGIENGKTIKESLESFLGKRISKALKKPLSILNELLSIAKTFI